VLHVDIPSRPEIEKLALSRAEPSVTIYIKTTPLTQEIGASRITLKNLAQQGLEQLRAAGTDKRRLSSIDELLSEIGEDDAFWALQANSLALFATPDGLMTYRLANHIPDQVHVSDRFHIQPLLRAVTFPHSAFILVLGENGVKFYQLDADSEPVPVRVPDLPKDAGDALGKTTLNDRSPSGRIHGSEGQNVRLRQYVRIVDQALRHVLTGHSRPLIIAATNPLASMFRQATTYPYLAAGDVKGNAERMSMGELAAGARSVLDELYAAQVAEMKALYVKREAEGRATADVAQAARAATFGAIDTLLFDMNANEAGIISEKDGSVRFGKPGPDTYGIVDEIACRALATGAKVMAVRKPDLPTGEALSAILRYPI
jgi:hypothetical protein